MRLLRCRHEATRRRLCTCLFFYYCHFLWSFLTTSQCIARYTLLHNESRGHRTWSSSHHNLNDHEFADRRSPHQRQGKEAKSPSPDCKLTDITISKGCHQKLILPMSSIGYGTERNHSISEDQSRNASYVLVERTRYPFLTIII